MYTERRKKLDKELSVIVLESVILFELLVGDSAR